MKFSFAVALLLAPAAAVKISQQSSLPPMPPAKEVVKVVGQGLNDVAGQVAANQGAIAANVDGAGQALTGALKQGPGVELPQGFLPSGKDVAGAVNAEVGRFAKGFNAHQDEIARDLDRTMTQVEQQAKQMGLAQQPRGPPLPKPEDIFYGGMGQLDGVIREISRSKADDFQRGIDGLKGDLERAGFKFTKPLPRGEDVRNVILSILRSNYDMLKKNDQRIIGDIRGVEQGVKQNLGLAQIKDEGDDAEHETEAALNEAEDELRRAGVRKPRIPRDFADGEAEADELLKGLDAMEQRGDFDGPMHMLEEEAGRAGVNVDHEALKKGIHEAMESGEHALEDPEIRGALEHALD